MPGKRKATTTPWMESKPKISRINWAFHPPKKIRGHDICENPLFMWLADEVSASSRELLMERNVNTTLEERSDIQARAIRQREQELRANFTAYDLMHSAYVNARAEVAVLEDQVSRLQAFIQDEYKRCTSVVEEDEFRERLGNNQVVPSFLESEEESSEFEVDLIEDEDDL